MFTINVTNNFVSDVTINGSVKVSKGGGTGTTGSVGGTQTVDVPGMGAVLVIDLAQQKIAGYDLKQTWGVLLRYKSVELYYRYEGEGRIDMTVDGYGSVNVTGVQGSAIIISLPELTFIGE